MAEITAVVPSGGRDTAWTRCCRACTPRLPATSAVPLPCVRDLNLRLCLVLLREKGGTQRWQPSR